jgi:hypothetical protein
MMDQRRSPPMILLAKCHVSWGTCDRCSREGRCWRCAQTTKQGMGCEDVPSECCLEGDGQLCEGAIVWLL